MHPGKNQSVAAINGFHIPRLVVRDHLLDAFTIGCRAKKFRHEPNGLFHRLKFDDNPKATPPFEKGFESVSVSDGDDHPLTPADVKLVVDRHARA